MVSKIIMFIVFAFLIFLVLIIYVKMTNKRLVFCIPVWINMLLYISISSDYTHIYLYRF